MKKSGACTKCGGSKLFHISRVEQTYCDAMASTRSFDVTAAQVRTGKKGLLGGDATETISAGPYEAYVCAGCGYAEWYASPAALQRLARIAEEGATVRIVDRDDAPRKP